jgi:hypothetical protein
VGYTGEAHGMDVVRTLAGQPVASLRAFVEQLHASLIGGAEFVEIETARGDLLQRLVLDAAGLQAATERVKARYQIPSNCSHHYRDLC